MSSGIIGADPQALRDMATKFDAAAQDLLGTKASVQMWVDRSDLWRGLDNQYFVSDWSSTCSPVLIKAAEMLRNVAGVLRTNADAQDVASAVSGSGIAGSGLFPSSGVTHNPADGREWPTLDLSVPETVYAWVRDTLKTVKLGADAIAWVNKVQFAAAAADGNMPLMYQHFMHQADAKLLSSYLGEVGDSLGHVGNVLAVLGAYDEITSDSVGDKVMGAVHVLTAGISYMGPVGKAGASVIGAFESIMPTTVDQQQDVVNFGISSMYPGVAFEDLTPAQMDKVTARYDGVPGFGNMLADTAGSHWVRGMDNAKSAYEVVSASAGDGYSAVADFFGWK